MKINCINTFLIVTSSALAGMIMGGLFGYCAGSIAPELFVLILIKQTQNPLGMAVVTGSFGGLLCGGALGAFAITTELIQVWLQMKSTKSDHQKIQSD